jgi:hypothetical protein
VNDWDRRVHAARNRELNLKAAHVSLWLSAHELTERLNVKLSVKVALSSGRTGRGGWQSWMSRNNPPQERALAGVIGQVRISFIPPSRSWLDAHLNVR